MRTHNTPPQAAIGVFDSGIGGLSVLQALRKEMPNERFIYLADTQYAPYGERSEEFVACRTLALSRYLVQKHHVKALVLACNTATAAAIDQVRERFPLLPIVGVEPALKPAATASRTGHIAVIATRGTVTSKRFARLLAQLPPGTHCRVQACDGLASAIETDLTDFSHEGPAEGARSAAAELTRDLCERYLFAVGPFGVAPDQVDTLVLGCTHYVFAQAVMQEVLGSRVQIFSTGEPVARQTKRLLARSGALHESQTSSLMASVYLLSTGDGVALSSAAKHWLNIESEVRCLSRHRKKMHEKQA